MANLTTTAGGATSQKLKELKMKQMRREAKSPINFNSKASVVDFKSANKDMKKS